MAYVGGKARSADHILDILNDPVFDGLDYVEPFVGYCHVLRRVKNKRSYTAYDNDRLVIALFKGLKRNLPYPLITKERYNQLKRACAKRTSFECAIGAFAYSYNGKKWGGYAPVSKDGAHDYLKQRLRYYEALKRNLTFKRTSFRSADYRLISLPESPALVYCDPPYLGTTQYGAEFDSKEFWDVMRDWSTKHYVVVSEYRAPRDFKCVATKRKAVTLNNKRGETVYMYEKVFVYRKGLFVV